MNPLQPLLALLAVAEGERDHCLAECRRVARAAELAARQNDQLIGYRSDYEQRWTSRFRSEASMPVLNCYQGFMERLGQAVSHQDQVMRRTGEQLAAAEQALRQHELRVASVRKLIERREHELRQGSERREQKATDEFAARAAMARHTGMRAALR